MTVVLGKPPAQDAAWSSMPGWGIVADLTPPELRARRTLIVLRRGIAVGLALLVVICAGVYLLAAQSSSAAQSDLDATTAQTGVIQAEIDKHSAVTQVKSATAGIDSQLSGLFATDVDVSALVQALRGALPAGMAITSINVTINAASTPASYPNADSVGTVTLAGTSGKLNDLARYVSALNGLRGVTAVIPSSNAAGGGGVSWTLSLQVSDARYTHRFRSAAPTTTTGTPAAGTTTTGGN